jgi:hypothetical protein
MAGYFVRRIFFSSIAGLTVTMVTEASFAGNGTATADNTHPVPVTTIEGEVTGKITGGKVTLLKDHTEYSLGGKIENVKPKEAEVLPYLDDKENLVGSYQVAPVLSGGPSFKPSAFAIITNFVNKKGEARWSDAGSYAKIENNSPPPNPPQTETANSSYVVTDPMTIEDIGDADAVTFETIIGTGASLTLGSVASFVSYSGSDMTTLNELGTIWSWTWSASGLDPGHWSFSFVSNPSLGLDDAASHRDRYLIPMAGITVPSRQMPLPEHPSRQPGRW